MLNFSAIWIFLLAIRESLNIFGIPTFLLSVGIFIVQFFQLFLIMQKENWHFTYYHILLFILILLCVYNIETLSTVNILLSVILLKRSNIKNVTLILVCAVFIEFFIYFAGFGLGILTDISKSYAKGVTHDLGFGNSNTASLNFTMLMLIFVMFIMQKSRIKFPAYILLILNYYIYKLTLGRTYFYCVNMLFFLLFSFSFKRNYVFERKAIVFLPIVLFIGTFVGIFFFNKDIVLNSIFTGRFALNYETVKDFSIVDYILGHSSPDGAMDSTYLGLLLKGGVFSVFMFLFITTKGLFCMSLKSFKIFGPFIFVMLVACFTETILPLFYPITILFYKILTDQYEFKYVQIKYLKKF